MHTGWIRCSWVARTSLDKPGHDGTFGPSAQRPSEVGSQIAFAGDGDVRQLQPISGGAELGGKSGRDLGLVSARLQVRRLHAQHAGGAVSLQVDARGDLFAEQEG